jgi:hypothetical protein
MHIILRTNEYKLLLGIEQLMLRKEALDPCILLWQTGVGV